MQVAPAIDTPTPKPCIYIQIEDFYIYLFVLISPVAGIKHRHSISV